jgi:sugar lactone lactonase YvrE
MKKPPVLPALLLLIPLGLAAGPAAAAIEWQSGPALKSANAPVDVAISADGNRSFVLSKGGKIQIYDKTGKLSDTLDVDPATDHIAADGDGNRLLISSNANGSAQQIEISYRFPFDYKDSPFLGKADAPVVLAVFSDFQ